MRTKTLAVSATLLAAMGATVAASQMARPWAVAPLSPVQSRTVTLDFSNAPARQVFDALKRAGVSFVADTTAVPSDRRLTVHVKNQPVDRAVEAVADALGLSVHKKGNVYSLKSAFEWATPMAPGAPSGFRVAVPQAARAPKAFQFEWSGKDGSKAAKQWEKMSEEFAKKMKDMPHGVWEFKEAPEGSWQFKEAPGGVWRLKGVPDPKGLEKRIHEQLKEAPDVTVLLKDLPDEAKLKEEIERSLKEMPEFRGQFKELPDGSKLKEEIERSLKNMPEFKGHLKELPDGSKIKEEIERGLKGLPKREGAFGELYAPRMVMGDIGKLVKSLSAEQWSKSKSKGYLTPDDLTQEQRRMLGTIAEDGDFTVTFSKDGKSVTIKGK